MRLLKSKPSPSTAHGKRNTQHTQHTQDTQLSHDGSRKLFSQDVSLRDTDPEKLADKLRVLFGNEPYEVELRHSVYCIRVPRNLSDGELAECSLPSGFPFEPEDPRQPRGTGWRAWGLRLMLKRR